MFFQHTDFYCPLVPHVCELSIRLSPREGSYRESDHILGPLLKRPPRGLDFVNSEVNKEPQMKDERWPQSKVLHRKLRSSRIPLGVPAPSGHYGLTSRQTT